jgi:Tol biopolymer transport system component
VPISGGGDVTELFKGSSEQMIYKPAWSPDGTAVWFPVGTFDLRRTNQLWRVFIEDGQAERVDLAEAGLRDIGIHPDGQQLAFISGTLGLPIEVWVLENFLPSAQAPR